ncbi:hypothetical protein JW592_05520 [Streptomyces sp. DW4-2]|uniref:Integral membrane protein n=2 Tax=Streptomyces spirodelae TaxID=2812904 RepID=A0ABS3WP89_9ACTN|nr:hypothetical protein [Streptomyces spirodelae]
MARTAQGNQRAANGADAVDGASGADGASGGDGVDSPDDAAYAAALIRAELAPRELWARVALIVGLCVGCGFLASGIYDYTHVGRPKGLAANLSLGIGAALLPTALALLLPLRGRSRDRHRLIELYGAPEYRSGSEAERALRGRRAGWWTVCVIALSLAFIFLATALTEAFSSDPYEEPDPTIYGSSLAWAAILTAGGCAGIAKVRRYRPRGTPGGGLGSGMGTTARRTGRPTPTSPRARLYARLGSRPAAPHRLSTRLDARVQRLSRPAAVALATAATLVGCALAGAIMLVPRYVGGGRPLFWTLLVVTALYLLGLLLELTYYGPRRRYLLLVIFAGIALFPVSGYGYSTSVLVERGEWVRVEMTEVHHHAKGGPTCDLRPLTRGAVVENDNLTISCDEDEAGDTLRVFADPRGEVRPRRSQPSDLTSFYVGWGIASTVLVGCAVGAALYGHRRRRELGLNTTEGESR